MGRVWRAAILFVTLIVACAPIGANDDAQLPLAGGRATDTDPGRAADATVSRGNPPVVSLTGTARAFPYTPDVEWMGTTVNHDTGRDGAPIQYVVIHYTDISYDRTLRAFTNPNSQVSAHYVVRRDGHIAQLVGEADTAWHAGNYWFNQRSIGIEMELEPRIYPFFMEEQYMAGAEIACAEAKRYGVPLDRAHLVGHNEVPGATHTDPGPTWNWEHFMWLVSQCAPANANTLHGAWVAQSPSPSIASGQTAGVTVKIRNTGSMVWRKGTPQEARLGVRNNDLTFVPLGLGWPAPTRVAVQAEDAVQPGQEATFTFTVKGLAPGSYVMPLRGVVDGGAWMEDQGIYVRVDVHPADRAVARTPR